MRERLRCALPAARDRRRRSPPIRAGRVAARAWRCSCAGSPDSAPAFSAARPDRWWRSEEHTSELQSLMRTSYAVFCLKKKKKPEAYIPSIDQHEYQMLLQLL